MIKAILVRLLGLVIAATAFAPALVAALKGVPFDLVANFRGLYHPLWWWGWVWGWMPALRVPWNSWADVGWSLPGIVAVGIVGVGLALAFGKRRKKTVRRWEERP